MTVPIWARTGGYTINHGQDRVVWLNGRPMLELAGVAGSRGPVPAFQAMVDEDLYGHEIGFICYGSDAPLPEMQHGDLYG